jgi:hypothetical protein
MPEVQNLHQLLVFMEPVVDPNWRMEDLADATATRNRSAEPWKATQQLNVVKKSVAEALRAARKVKVGIFYDLCARRKCILYAKRRC